MAKMIKCPVCGESNPAELEFCQYCQSPLHPDRGAARDSGGSIMPGQIPTQKVTAELEPILPQWLRDARHKARQTAEEEAAQLAQQKRTEPTTPINQPPDLLAGLQSQSNGDEDEETPDWLTSITGIPAKSKKPGIDSKEARWIELDDSDATPAPPGVSAGTNRITATQAPSEAAPDAPLPPWLAGLDSGQQTGGRDELADFFSQADSGSEKNNDDSLGLSGAGFGSAGSYAQPQNQPSEQDSDSWMKNLRGEQFSPPSSKEQDAGSFKTDVPEWLRGMDQADSAKSQEPAPEPFSDTPDWMKSLDAQQPAQYSEASPPAQPAADTPDWLKGFASNAEPAEAQPLSGTPEWLKDSQSPKPETSVSDSSEDIPDWLKSFGSGQVPETQEPSEPIQPAFTEKASVTPDWLKTFQPADEKPEEAAPAAPAFTVDSSEGAPIFTDDALGSGDLDTLFTDMPDWLSSPSAAPKPEKELPPAAQSAENISPASLPSWVQAMRPMESAIPSAPQSLGADQAPEARGPLAGLQGVLPATPFTPTSKPKAYSIKLQATQEQQGHAALLEHILETETKPEPISIVPMVNSVRGLRWGIAILLLLVAVGSLLAGTQIFSLPLGMPVELQTAIQAVESVPDNAPVLLVFDYDPATVGEMEALASPLVDHMVLLHHPRFAFISTSPTGAALAERFISGPLGGHNYQSGAQYTNLGYLSGGLAGIRAFTQNPRAVAPLSASLNLAWDNPSLQDVQSFSNFALILLITDSAETGRAWMEQAGPLRGNIPLVVASSAQAGPMLLPYVQSGQVTGLVNGLNSGAVMEQNNSGRPGFARRYWDSYSISLFAVVAIMVIGGLWNSALGLRARAATMEES